MSEKVQVHSYAEDDHSITILEGHLPDQDGSRMLEISGSITAPGSWLEGNTPASDLAHVIFNKPEQRITYYDKPDRLHRIKVAGRLQNAEPLNSLYVNSSLQRRKPKDLANELRKIRHFAADRSEFMEVISSLKTLSFRFKSEGYEAKDNDGQMTKNYHKKIESSIKRFFSLAMPVFQGELPVIIPIEIVVETDGQNVWLWLESLDLYEMKEEMIEDIFQRERKRFEEITIIDK